MVDLANATRDMLVRAVELDQTWELESQVKEQRGENPWPHDWRALKDLVKVMRNEHDPVVDWLHKLVCEAARRSSEGDMGVASISALLMRAVVVGYNLAKEQMAVELERVAN